MAIRAFAIISCFLAACLFLWLAFQWLTIGYGLNPWIALPFTILFYWAPIFMLLEEAEIAQVDIADLLEHINSAADLPEYMQD